MCVRIYVCHAMSLYYTTRVQCCYFCMHSCAYTLYTSVVHCSISEVCSDHETPLVGTASVTSRTQSTTWIWLPYFFPYSSFPSDRSTLMRSGCLQLWPTSLWASRCSNTSLPSGALPCTVQMYVAGPVWAYVKCRLLRVLQCQCVYVAN